LISAAPGYPSTEEYLKERLACFRWRAHIGRMARRGRWSPSAADASRSPLLGHIKLPVHIIHGATTRLWPVAAGHYLAANKGRPARRDRRHGARLPAASVPRFTARQSRRSRAGVDRFRRGCVAAPINPGTA